MINDKQSKIVNSEKNLYVDEKYSQFVNITQSDTVQH